jgi:glycosyltransferase involved in cell wall biosynthesis
MISVCIATYNGEEYIEEQLRSILQQLGEADEVIVSDDQSSDATLDVVRSLHDPRVRIIVNPDGPSYTRNFEHALRASHGDIIFLSDQDDVWMDHKVELMQQALLDADLVVSDAVVVDSRKHEMASSFYAVRKPRRTFCGNILKFGYLGCCVAMRRRVLNLAMPFPTDRRLCTHDNWIFLVALAFFKVRVLKQPLLLYRRHDGTASTGAINSRKSFLFRLHYRLYLLWNIIKRAKRSYYNK